MVECDPSVIGKGLELASVGGQAIVDSLSNFSSGDSLI